MGGRRRSEQRGSASVEFAIIAPAFLALFGLMFMAGRIGLAGQSAEHAAAEAARTASISRDAGEAQAEANAAAKRALAQEDLHCSSTSVSVSTGGFAARLGQDADVTVTVACTVSLADLSLVGFMPGSRTVRATASSPIDPYRER